ncbi:MAG: hypothetical protein E7224_07340 [Clostridiales bacterium]|nr:hypothetical protein [Clostridiales bacterium]
MFVRKKPFWQRKWFYFVIVGIFAFGYWANRDMEDLTQLPGDDLENQAVMEVTPADDGDPFIHSQERILPDEVIRAQAALEEAKKASAADSSSTSEENTAGDPEDPESQLKYYLIKEVNGVIQVYCVDRAGKETLYWNTEIPFSLLSETDQKLFSDGLEIQSQAGLEELLQDFSS